MTLRLVGAGNGRTGTHSLKLALEQLLGAPCYHMMEVFSHPEHVPAWHGAAQGQLPDWEELFRGYAATVDWPGAAFWRELSLAFPEAVVLLSVRADAEDWWRSADRTVFEIMRRDPLPGLEAWHRMCVDLVRTRFSERFGEHDDAVAAYQRHNDEVRATVPADRLVEWRPGDGWAPLCAALDLPVPDQPFPHVNTTAEFRSMAGFDVPQV